MPFTDLIKKMKALQDTHDAHKSLKENGLISPTMSGENLDIVHPPQSPTPTPTPKPFKEYLDEEINKNKNWSNLGKMGIKANISGRMLNHLVGDGPIKKDAIYPSMSPIDFITPKMLTAPIGSLSNGVENSVSKYFPKNGFPDLLNKLKK